MWFEDVLGNRYPIKKAKKYMKRLVQTEGTTCHTARGGRDATAKLIAPRNLVRMDNLNLFVCLETGFNSVRQWSAKDLNDENDGTKDADQFPFPFRKVLRNQFNCGQSFLVGLEPFDVKRELEQDRTFREP
jgi:hypothetical protein